MTLVRWQPRTVEAPWRHFVNANRGWNRMLDNFFTDDEDATMIRWRPAVDIAETDKEFTVSAELPGMTRDDIELTIKDDMLTLKGEKKSMNGKEDENVYLAERCYGKFTRSFTLNNKVNAKNVKADFHEGILTIHLPKVEEAKPKSIEIAVK